jgi:hypothetical protein
MLSALRPTPNLEDHRLLGLAGLRRRYSNPPLQKLDLTVNIHIIPYIIYAIIIWKQMLPYLGTSFVLIPNFEQIIAIILKKKYISLLFFV